MKQIKMAMARFYNAQFISLDNKEKIIWKHLYKDLEVVARLSKTTTYSKWGPVQMEGEPNYPYPGPEKYPADMYCEIISYKMIEVSDEEYDMIHAESLEARDRLYKQFDQFDLGMRRSIDYCAGMLGVRVSPELVSLPIFDVEQRYAFINDRVYAVEAGMIIQVRGRVNVIHETDEAIQHSLDVLKLSKKNKVEKATESLSWLLRGWQTEDPALRFVSFFTALEFIIPGHQSLDKATFDETRKKIIALIEQDDELKEIKIDQYLFRFLPSVSFLNRFEKFASSSQLYDWNKDVEDFKNYYAIRNAMLHRGQLGIGNSISIEDKLVKNFEQFVQKYVRFILYGIRKPVAFNNRERTIIRNVANFSVKDLK